jgi:hypothetical protein
MHIRHIPGRTASYLAVACTALLLGAGGLAFASSGGGVIHGCVSKATGALRIANRCKKKHERAISWNAQGPRGLQGIQGPPGPSSAFSGSIAGPVTITSSVTPGDKVGHLNLQPGSYVIFAKAWIENQSSSFATTAGCELDAGTDSDIDFIKLEPTTAVFRGVIALNVAHTFTSAGTAQLSCFTGSGVTVTANNAVVTAIQVGSLMTNALLPG